MSGQSPEMSNPSTQVDAPRRLWELGLQVRGLLARITDELKGQPLRRRPIREALEELDKVFDRLKIRGSLYAASLATDSALLRLPKDSYPGSTVMESFG